MAHGHTPDTALEPRAALAAVVAELQRRLQPARRRSVGLSEQFLDHVPVVKCADGLTMSVQASRYHYCEPRDSLGPWRSVEVGFPSRRVDAFMPFIGGGQGEDPTETVYGYVPLSIVAQAILAAGGFAPVAASEEA